MSPSSTDQAVRDGDAEDFQDFPPCGVFGCTIGESHGHASRGTFAKPAAIRFATPEIEAAVRAGMAKKREEKRRNRLLMAIRNFCFNRCQGHGSGGTGSCVVCAINFFLDGEAAQALELIDAELAATVPTLVQFGHGWRIPVGTALAARIVELRALPAGERMMQQIKGTDLVPEPPVIDMICTGGIGPADCPTHMRLSPLEDGHTAPGLAIDVPIAFLLEHGVRFA